MLLDRVVQNSQGVLLQLEAACEMIPQDSPAKSHLNAALQARRNSAGSAARSGGLLQATSTCSLAESIVMDTPITVLVVDDHPVFREGIAAVLSLERDIQVVAEAQTVAEALSQFRLYRPHVVLMDIKLPDGSGVDATERICREFPLRKGSHAHDLQGRRPSAHGIEGGRLGVFAKKHGAS
jgi:PleD family two-component response regulator